MKLLCLSNGHGEDIIAVQIIQHLQRHSLAPDIAALPLVGEGHAYSQHQIPIIGPVQNMPSGGFIYMDGKQLGRDLRGGLLQLTWAQYQAMGRWMKSSGKGKILAVGDIVPLLFAWLSGADYGFVGTAKSEYYLRDEGGWLPQTNWFRRMMGSVYEPWERWLMSRRRCKAVFPRDKLTTDILRQWSIPAFDLGNPMMDGLESQLSLTSTREEDRPLVIVLLPGSRVPEAENNWQQILQALRGIMSEFKHNSLLFLSAIAPSLNLAVFEESALIYGWKKLAPDAIKIPINDLHSLYLTKNNATLVLTQNSYADCLNLADLGIAMAGTATEQVVGLGKPVITMPGNGPQFTYRFAEAQARLLGHSIILVKQPELVVKGIKSLFQDADRLHLIAVNGKRRMGQSGAAQRIANCLTEILQ